MTDLIRELRRHERDYASLVHGPLCGQAADEIERLSEQNARYRGALEIIAGQPAHVLESMQAKAALENIGPALTPASREGA